MTPECTLPRPLKDIGGASEIGKGWGAVGEGGVMTGMERGVKKRMGELRKGREAEQEKDWRKGKEKEERRGRGEGKGNGEMERNMKKNVTQRIKKRNAERQR